MTHVCNRYCVLDELHAKCAFLLFAIQLVSYMPVPFHTAIEQIGCASHRKYWYCAHHCVAGLLRVHYTVQIHQLGHFDGTFKSIRFENCGIQINPNRLMRLSLDL